MTPTPDTKAASTEVVSSASGATLSATGADGTRFTFHIPPDALLSDETVTLTPVSALHGSPLGSLVGAVSVTPDGLELNKQGTLTITPGHPAPAQAGFVAAFGGRDFSLYPLGTPGRAPALVAQDSGGTTTMSISTLSTYGVASATTAQVNAALSNPPASAQAQWQQIAAADLRSSNASDLVAVANAYFQQYLLPLGKEALTDDSKVDTACIELLSWSRQMQILELDSDPTIKADVAQVMPLYIKILVNRANRVYEDCKQNHNLKDFAKLAEFERWAEINGGIDLGAAAHGVEKCGHFELKLTTDIGYGGWDLDVSLDMQLTTDAIGDVTGKADPVVARWTISPSHKGCVSWKTDGVDIQPSYVDSMGLDKTLDLIQSQQPNGEVVDQQPQPQIALAFEPGDTRELWSRSGCEGNVGPTSAELWILAWYTNHASERDGSAHVHNYVYLLRGWDMSPLGPDPLLATKTYHFTTNAGPGSTQTEDTKLELYIHPE